MIAKRIVISQTTLPEVKMEINLQGPWTVDKEFLKEVATFFRTSLGCQEERLLIEIDAQFAVYDPMEK